MTTGDRTGEPAAPGGGSDGFMVWANVYRALNGAMGSVHATRELADRMAGRDRIACVALRVHEGLGLNGLGPNGLGPDGQGDSGRGVIRQDNLKQDNLERDNLQRGNLAQDKAVRADTAPADGESI